MVERELPKLIMRVRFPLPAPVKTALAVFLLSANGNRTRKGSLRIQTTDVVCISARAAQHLNEQGSGSARGEFRCRCDEQC